MRPLLHSKQAVDGPVRVFVPRVKVELQCVHDVTPVLFKQAKGEAQVSFWAFGDSKYKDWKSLMGEPVTEMNRWDMP